MKAHECIHFIYAYIYLWNLQNQCCNVQLSKHNSCICNEQQTQHLHTVSKHNSCIQRANTTVVSSGCDINHGVSWLIINVFRGHNEVGIWVHNEPIMWRIWSLCLLKSCSEITCNSSISWSSLIWFMYADFNTVADFGVRDDEDVFADAPTFSWWTCDGSCRCSGAFDLPNASDWRFSFKNWPFGWLLLAVMST